MTTREEQSLVYKYLTQEEMSDFKENIDTITITEYDKCRAKTIIEREIFRLFELYYKRAWVDEFKQHTEKLSNVTDFNFETWAYKKSVEQIEREILSDSQLKFYSELVGSRF